MLADGVVPGVLPDNCRVHRFGAGTQAGRGVRFESALVPGAARRGRSAVIAHMCPIYAVLAAPLVRPLGIPLLLWYTHWRAGRTLRLAERARDRDRHRRHAARSRFVSPKVVPIGHGIDMQEFACADHPPADVAAGGRARPLLAGEGARDDHPRGRAGRRACGSRCTGPRARRSRSEHRGRARAPRRRAPGAGRARHAALPREELPALFARADLLVNNMRAGAPDKVVYEAAASCLPVIASNPVFDESPPSSASRARTSAELAKRLRAFAALPAAERAVVGRALREARRRAPLGRLTGPTRCSRRRR